MKREILFRGLKTDGTGWVYGDLTTRCPFPVGIYDDEGLHEVDPSTVGQSLEKFDLTGKLAFEDDIFKDQNGKIWVISYSVAQNAFLCSPKDREWQESKHMHHIEIAEITGNIHELTT